MAQVLECGMAEAKAKLSTLVADVQETGKTFVIKRYNRPAAMLVPVPFDKGGKATMKGRLKHLSDPRKREMESTAWGQAVEAKHGNAAGR